MEEIKVGEYVRTKKGIIAKVGAIYEYGKREKYKRYFTKKNEEFNEGTLIKEHLIYDTRQKYIPKHSKNIIDLIEVGDIIEWEYKKIGYYGINEVINRFGTIGVYGIEYDDVISLKYIAIKRILTHEQFENNCYRIGE